VIPGGFVVLSIALCVLALLAAARGLVRHNTWYLASDQFAFLTFADDLLRGRVFHDPATTALLAGPRAREGVSLDAYYQTYIWRDGALYSRYPPGFPALLALAKLLGGETAQHWLNPVLYLVLLALVARLGWKLAWSSPATRLAAAVASIWALLVIPIEVHYWGITVARDLPAHLLALSALLAALGGHAGRAGLGLGLAASIRPDAALWAVSIGPALRSAPDRGSTLRGLLGFALGTLPLFAYNTITQGHPFSFTQGSEFRWLFVSGGHMAQASLLGAVSLVSGGAFRLANFPATFPAHVRYLATGFGAFLVLALGTLGVGIARRRPIAPALGPYAFIAFLFYSCWGHGDPRYLVGVSLCLIILAAVGAAELAAFVADAGVPWQRRALLVGAAVVATLAFDAWVPRDPARGLTALERAVTAAIVLAGALPLLPVGRRLAGWAPIVPALAFASFGMARLLGAQGGYDSFQAEQIARARAAVESLVPAGSIVLTSPALGRPAENITHYTHADAHYVGELKLLFSSADLALARCGLNGRRLFLLLGAAEPLPFKFPRQWWSASEVARRTGDALRDWFVDPRRVPEGAVLYEATMSPILLRR